MPTLDDAINAIRAGNREEGRQILEEVLETDESNEDVWLWLSSVVETDEDREICLENVLALNPDNVVARQYGVLKEKMHKGRDAPLPVSFLIDPDGIVRYAPCPATLDVFLDPRRVVAQLDQAAPVPA